MCNNHLCPFCSFPLLSHIRGGKLYWFCQSCTQEVPYGIYQGDTVIKNNQDNYLDINYTIKKKLSITLIDEINDQKKSFWESNISNFLMTIQQFLEADRVILYQIQTTGKLKIIAESLLSNCSSSIRNYKVNNFFTSESISKLSEGKTEFIPDLAENIKSESRETIMTSLFSLKSQLAIPILVKDELNKQFFLWGIITAHTSYKIASWSEKEIKLCELLVQQISLSIEQEYRYQHLCKLINHDQLTNLPNRHYFEDVLSQKWQDFSRLSLTISLLICEVNFRDDWKLTDDQESWYKYQEKFIYNIDKFIDNRDKLIAHYREQSFVILLPNCLNINKVIDRIKQEFNHWKTYYHQGNNMGELELNLGHATVVPNENNLPESLVIAAHHNLKHWKKQNSQVKQPKIIQKVKGRQANLMSNEEVLMGYVAYFLSRGKTIVTPHHSQIEFKDHVYEYYGYNYNYINFWQKIRQLKEFGDFYLMGDTHSFDELLTGNYTVNSCSRCNLPIPIPVGMALDIPSCSLCKNKRLKKEYKILIFQDKNIDNIHSWDNLLRINGVRYYIFPNPDVLMQEYLHLNVDLIFIDVKMSPRCLDDWAEKIHGCEGLKDVPIIALSEQASQVLPWQEQELSVIDYVLMPLNGAYLGEYLRKICQGESGFKANKLHWFPK
jgi:PleD family two-component response regulator